MVLVTSKVFSIRTLDVIYSFIFSASMELWSYTYWHLLDRIQPPIITAAKTGRTRYRVFTTKTPHSRIDGTKLLCAVFSIHLEDITIMAGIRKNTVIRLKMIAFVSTRPRSIPIPNCISISATMPETVVRLLEEISGIALLRATVTASMVSFVSCSSIKRCTRIIA